jgi:hypothetical protein
MAAVAVELYAVARRATPTISGVKDGCILRDFLAKATHCNIRSASNFDVP